MDALLAQGYMYFPYIAHLLFIVGAAFLFSRAMSVYTGLLLGFLLPILVYTDALRPLAFQLALASNVLKGAGIFGHARSLYVRPEAVQA